MSSDSCGSRHFLLLLKIPATKLAYVNARFLLSLITFALRSPNPGHHAADQADGQEDAGQPIVKDSLPPLAVAGQNQTDRQSDNSQSPVPGQAEIQAYHPVNYKAQQKADDNRPGRCRKQPLVLSQTPKAAAATSKIKAS